MKDLTRRSLLGGLAAWPILGAARAEEAKEPARPALPQHKNEEFYTDGKLDAAKAKQAYYELMEYHRFPVFPRLKTDDLWVLDFALGKFTEVGMGGIFYINNQRDNYLLHDIWLLPGQMIPEHYHVKTEKVAAKMEAWLVRNGTAYFYSEGEPTPGVDERIPPTHRGVCRAKHEMLKRPGEVVVLEVAESRLWVKAGPEGAIVTEVATYHDMGALRFSHPNIKL